MILHETDDVCVVEKSIRKKNLDFIFNQIDSTTKKRLIIGNGFEPVEKSLIYQVFDYADRLSKFDKIAACTCNMEEDWEIEHWFNPEWMMPMKWHSSNIVKDVTTKTDLFHFVNRTPRKHRTEALLELRKTNLDKHGVVSYSGGFDFAEENLNPSSVINDFPIVLDKADVSFNDILGDGGWPGNSIYPHIKHSLFGLIGETLFDKEWHPTQYDSFFISEKTFSCFSLLQIPIIIGQIGAVEHCRMLGFDMFDDIVDHSYDEVHDPYERLKLATSQIGKLLEIKPQKFIDEHILRFYHNTNQMESVWRFYQFRLEHQLKKFTK